MRGRASGEKKRCAGRSGGGGGTKMELPVGIEEESRDGRLLKRNAVCEKTKK